MLEVSLERLGHLIEVRLRSDLVLATAHLDAVDVGVETLRVKQKLMVSQFRYRRLLH